MKLSTLVLLTATMSASAVECQKFSNEQLEVLQVSKTTGHRYGLGEILAAISIKESFAGKYVINAHSQDFGAHQVKYTNICHHAKITAGTFKCNVEVQKVVFDATKSAQYALLTLVDFYDHYWREPDETRLKKALASYKSGWNYKPGLSYADEVLAISENLATCQSRYTQSPS